MNILSPKWTSRFINLAYSISLWSKDPSTKVGCIIVTKEGHPLSFGYNGIPRNLMDSHDRLESNLKYHYFAHAEQNAIDLCQASLKNSILFCTHMPCSSCARSIIQNDISTVIINIKNGMLSKFVKRHGKASEDSHIASYEMFKESGITYMEVSNNYHD